jgi:hypothetical protein
MISGLRGRRRTYLTILKRAWSANFKMVWYVLLRPLRPELDGQLDKGFRQTLEGYISKDIYIPYPIQKSRKRIFPYPFFEWDMLKDIISLF